MSEAPTKQKLWGGRFTGKTDPLYVGYQIFPFYYTETPL